MTARNYREHVGPEHLYDVVGAAQFAMLTSLGLRETHKVLDIGCGSLRFGRLAILYLERGNYHGIDPNSDMVDEGITHTIGWDLCARKQPRFGYNADFQLDVFHTTYDFVIAQSVFTHAAMHQIQTCLANVKGVLNDSGVFMFNWANGKEDEDYTGDEWVYPGCTLYRTETIERLLDEAGLVYQHKRFRDLQWKSDWVMAANNQAAIDQHSHITSTTAVNKNHA